MNILKLANLALRFFLELCLLLAFAAWGYRLGDSTIKNFGLALLVALGVASVWGLFLAPKATRRLNSVVRLVLEVVLFSQGALALRAIGLPLFGLALICGYALNRILIFIWKQDV